MVEEPEQPFPPPPPPPPPPPEEGDGPEEPSEEPPPYEETATETTSAADDLPATEELDDPADDLPTDSAPFPTSSSTGSEDDTYTGPSTAENSQSHPAPQVEEPCEGSKSTLPPQREEPPPAPAPAPDNIPDELDPQQLAQLHGLKESNA
ncbi:diacylglycerol kinase kappa-like [Bacillus rossius redtenbacheri]|uniref:diacylglycerol kinase kappa-like n=1 Tax=Bacillus rossius redtenbacheri TaxID=93214 RepID=UPI002FDD6626